MARKSIRDLTREQQMARGPLDLPFLMLTMLLLGIGLIMLLSASSYAALYDRAAGYKVVDGVVKLGDPFFYFRHQLVYAILGVGVMYGVSRMNYKYWRRFAFPVLLVAFLLLILVKTPLGVNVNGATRWLHMLLFAGPTFQPSEVAKLGVVLVFAANLSKRRTYIPRLHSPMSRKLAMSGWDELPELVPYILILVIISGLLLLEPHLSGAILVMSAGAAILFAAGVRWRWFGLGGAIAFGLFLFVVKVVGYNSERLDMWLNPWSDPRKGGYQIIQSLYAVASGGLTGLGFGQSRQKYLYLPEEQNDYIFAIVCEELGFIGAALVIVLFALLIVRGYMLALQARDRFGTLLIVGIDTLMAVQVGLNIAVVLNALPSTGISLPFFSYGGTALMIQLAEIGIILAVARQIPAPRQE